MEEKSKSEALEELRNNEIKKDRLAELQDADIEQLESQYYGPGVRQHAAEMGGEENQGDAR